MMPSGLYRTLVLLALLAPKAHAQLSAIVDVGRRDAPVGVLGTRALWTVAPAVRLERARLRLLADGEYRDYGHLGRGLGGGVSGSYFVPLIGSMRGELTASARGASGGPGNAEGRWEGGGRFHFGGVASGIWLGSQVGGGTQGPALRWEAAAWRRVGNLTLQVEGSQLTVVGRVLRTDVAPDTLTPRPDTLYRDQARVSTDVAGWVHWAPPRAHLALAVGRRYGLAEVAGRVGGSIPPDGFGSQQPGSGRVTTSTWWLVEGTYWLTPRWGVIGSIGRRPPDMQLRAPGGRFLQLALRTAWGRTGLRSPSRSGGERGLRARRLTGGAVEVLLNAGTANRVELRGDFTDWRPIAMEPRGRGVWGLIQAIAPGLHRLSMRVDEGPWLPPPGVREVKDDFGEGTGVVLIE